jgi:hypothetical protein
LSLNSDDPNGTLITGLKNREKPFTQVYFLSRQIFIFSKVCAFEELAFIAYNVKDRRQTIFSERGQELSTWNHILRASLEVLAEVKIRHQAIQRTKSFFIPFNIA